MRPTLGRSVSLTQMKTLPLVGRVPPAAIWILAKAMPRSGSMPMTSPVLFISGPRMMFTHWNLLKLERAMGR